MGSLVTWLPVAQSGISDGCFRLLQTFLVTLAGAVGIYVPGGTAVLPSSALMLSVPAGLAGCKTIVLATPPRQDGSISPEVNC